MGLFSRSRDQQAPLPLERAVTITFHDLAAARALMEKWEACLGNSDAMYDCLEEIGRITGYPGFAKLLMMNPKGDSATTTTLLQRPWKWWAAMADYASQNGDHLLPVKVFLFANLYSTQLQPNMAHGDIMDCGLTEIGRETYRQMATLAGDSLAQLPPTLLVHDSATGKVDVANAIRMAEEVSGVPVVRTYGPHTTGPDAFNS